MEKRTTSEDMYATVSINNYHLPGEFPLHLSGFHHGISQRICWLMVHISKIMQFLHIFLENFLCTICHCFESSGTFG